MSGIKRSGIVLQDRDRRLLSELGVMRIIDREMTKVVAGFSSTTAVNIRLLALTRAGLLKRFFVGSTAHGLLQHTPCPVTVVPDRARTPLAA